MAQRPQRLCLLVVSVWVIGLGACRKSPDPPPGDVIADLALPGLNGQAFDPETLRGKKVLINFWSPT